MTDVNPLNVHRMRHPFGIGDPDALDHDGEIVAVAETFSEAVEKWEALVKRSPGVGFYITGWNHGVLAHFDEVRDLFAEPRGTFACPICLQDTPHTHTPEEIAADRKVELELQAMRAHNRAAILRRAENVLEMYGLPRLMLPEDIGL